MPIPFVIADVLRIQDDTGTALTSCLNSVKAKLVMRPSQTRWTSHAAYTGRVSCPEWLCTESFLEELAGREAYRRYIRNVQLGHRSATENPNFHLKHDSTTVCFCNIYKYLRSVPVFLGCRVILNGIDGTATKD